MKKPLCPACTEIVAERNRKGGSARSAKKTVANRANAKLPRKKQPAQPTGKRYASVAELIADAVDKSSKRVSAMSPQERQELERRGRVQIAEAAAKQNARQSRLRPKVGQVWSKDGMNYRVTVIEGGNVYSWADDCGGKHRVFASSCYGLDAWLADRKAGVIKIVRGSK